MEQTRLFDEPVVPKVGKSRCKNLEERIPNYSCKQVAEQIYDLPDSYYRNESTKESNHSFFEKNKVIKKHVHLRDSVEKDLNQGKITVKEVETNDSIYPDMFIEDQKWLESLNENTSEIVLYNKHY